MLNELSYFHPIAGSTRLLYNENAARLLQELTVPAHRAALARNEWAQSQLRNTNDARVLRIMRNLTMAPDAIRTSAVCGDLPAISMAEYAVGSAMLQLFDFAAGNGLNIGRAMMLVHALQATKNKSDIPRTI